MAYDINKIPKLPYGEGSISIFNDELLVYKKSIKKSNGEKIRKTVYGKTPKECMQKMRDVENELREKESPRSKELLCEELTKWLNTIKKPTLKAQSYKRLLSTVNRINNSMIGHYCYQSISSSEIQEVINELNDNYMSHSSIKKVYDCLNSFYRYVCARDKIDNPMLLVVMPTANNINAETKTIEFFEQEDIDKFIKECGTLYKSGTPKYKYGYALAANIYLGMRAGELLALQWKDIDFEKRTIYISKTLIEELNPEYDANNKELMEQKGIKKTKFTIQHSTKKSKNRYIPINSKAKDLLLKHKKISKYTNENDYVISTDNRKPNTISGISKILISIEKNSGTKVQSPGTHVLRHTCASLYFRANVPVETICQILGNTREVCEKTYIHFIEEQLKEAASKIDIIEI